MRRSRWVQRHDPDRRIELVGLADAPALVATEPGGRRFVGAAAVNRVLRELGGGWRLLGSLYLLPPIGGLEDRYYARVARRRAWW
ncbi:MAG: DUF393 domain-containing protein [Chloroflexi bacterium]|nr:MAG: DUF393 domain-containing protein [Chloroflexota bacterium]TME98159.1 MAG: DUF393 domain-containing protein [Chloroflexota bacterium]